MSGMICALCSGMLFYVNGHKACASCGHVAPTPPAPGVSSPVDAAPAREAEATPEPPPASRVRASEPVEAWQAGVEIGTVAGQLVGEAEQLGQRAARVVEGLAKDPQRAADQLGRDLVALVDDGAVLFSKARELGKRALNFLRS